MGTRIRYLAWTLSAVLLIGIGAFGASLFWAARSQNIQTQGEAMAEKWAPLYPYVDGHYPRQSWPSWAKTVERANFQSVSLDLTEQDLTRVFITKLGDKVTGVDFAGPTPLVSNSYDVILWDQCERIYVKTFISSTLTAPQRIAIRDAIADAAMELRSLTGLDIVFPGFLGTNTVESFTDNDLSDYYPADQTIEVHVAAQSHAALGDDDIALTTTWHSLTDTKRASINSALVSLTADVLDRFPDGGFDAPSRQMAVLHELTHAVGIGHSSDAASYMFHFLGTEAFITPADSTVLALAGSRPCFDSATAAYWEAVDRQAIADRDIQLYDYQQEVVGESHYQDALVEIVGNMTGTEGAYWRGIAEIAHDPENLYDKWAVAVSIDGNRVGYLPSAPGNIALIEDLAGQARSVPARAIGGYPTDDGDTAYFGIRLVLNDFSAE
ncbi:MAG: hypothetical protein QF558_09240 [Acidimicrobiales bacterium]|mgnify:CR=1 FL=1|jgi:hypothetical protein|nr:hypothetical protein [Acidimicrobiales bacterium]|tara:strand:- start:4812 stop:6128 length:1317 start_codon:yes stop_codon:yes gene_type:complete